MRRDGTVVIPLRHLARWLLVHHRRATSLHQWPVHRLSDSPGRSNRAPTAGSDRWRGSRPRITLQGRSNVEPVAAGASGPSPATSFGRSDGLGTIDMRQADRHSVQDAPEDLERRVDAGAIDVEVGDRAHPGRTVTRRSGRPARLSAAASSTALIRARRRTTRCWSRRVAGSSSMPGISASPSARWRALAWSSARRSTW